MNVETAETQRRLLETAAMVFAEHGFAATTIRMICGRANVNIAAINYHFGSKEALYHEVLRYARRCAYEKYPTTYGLKADATPEERLHAYVRSFLLRTFGNERNLGFGTLMMREMVEPTDALDMIVEEGLRNLFEQLVEIVQSLLGDDADDELAQSCSRSIMGQCVFYLCGKAVIRRMSPEQKFGPEDIEKISRQIVAFSLSALQGIKSQAKKKVRK